AIGVRKGYHSSSSSSSHPWEPRPGDIASIALVPLFAITTPALVGRSIGRVV
ncbi:hypothetical protein B9Z19DRAFT_1190698, partial [Tuber borchii]